jgi:hypothetical protein
LLIFLADLFGGRFLAMLGIRGVVLDAHLADMQFRITRFANIETTQR